MINAEISKIDNEIQIIYSEPGSRNCRNFQNQRRKSKKLDLNPVAEIAEIPKIDDEIQMS